jgi:hypothetical protein
MWPVRRLGISIKDKHHLHRISSSYTYSLNRIKILKIDDKTFRTLWYKKWFTLGSRDHNHSYIIKIGVGLDLDDMLVGPSFFHVFCFWRRFSTVLGVLADVLRNYIMQNTSTVFEMSYQAEHIRVNSLRQRFMPMYSDEEAWLGEHFERAMSLPKLTKEWGDLSLIIP